METMVKAHALTHVIVRLMAYTSAEIKVKSHKAAIAFKGNARVCAPAKANVIPRLCLHLW